MPELAAHLERVAKRERLAQQWAQSWLDTQSKAPGINLGEMEQSLAGMLLRWGAQYAKDESAAALAACAREEFVPIPHDKVVKLVDVMLGGLKLEVPEKVYMDARQTIIDYFDIIDLRVSKEALERAVGEK